MVETSLPDSVVALTVSAGTKEQVPVPAPGELVVTLTTTTNCLDVEFVGETSWHTLHTSGACVCVVNTTGRTSSASSGLWMLLAFSVT